MNIKTILFDLDGVLVDACEWHYHALNIALENNCNITISRKDHESTFNGIPTQKKLEILESMGLVREEQFKEIWNDKQAQTKKAIVHFSKIDDEKIYMHNQLLKSGYNIACVTNSIRETAELMLEKTGQLDLMRFVITNEDVVNPKPDSECYEKAMKILNCKPENTLIIEDSEKGYQAAIKSKAFVLKVNSCSEVNLENILNKIKLIKDART